MTIKEIEDIFKPKEDKKRWTIKIPKQDILYILIILFLLSMLITLVYRYNNLVDQYALVIDNCQNPLVLMGMI